MTAFDEGAGVERDLAWLLDDLASRVPDFKRAVILSRDGLLVAASQDLTREDAEHLSAVAAALQSLAAGTGERFRAGGVRQTVIELEQGLMFVIAAGEGSCLAALCPADADAGMVAYEMAMLVKRARPHLASHPRFPARPAAFPSSPATAELPCRPTAAIPCGGARARYPASGSAATPGRWSARTR